MEVRKPAKTLLVIAMLFYLLSAVMLYKGYDKMTNYRNPEYSFQKSHNAYVGGDAYNYIINGNYATGFFVLSGSFLITGTLFFGIYRFGSHPHPAEANDSIQSKIKEEPAQAPVSSES